MDIFYILCLSTFLQSTWAVRRLELTVVNLTHVPGNDVNRILLNIKSLDNPKIDASKSERTHTINIQTEEEILRVQIVHRLKTLFKIPAHEIKTHSLPDIQIKDNFRIHKRSTEQFDITAFNTHDSVNDYLDELAILHPDLITTKIIGYTHQDRPIKILILNSIEGGLKPKVFIDGGQHAREWISPAVVLHILHQLIEGYKSANDRLRSLVLKYEFHILPILNPDGYVYSYSDNGIRLWRKNMKISTTSNCTGVDLNRNWDFHWAGRGGSTDECSIVYQGQSAFSEMETQATSNYILSYQGQWHSYFSFHSFGQLILFPYSHTAIPAPDHDKLRLAAKSLAEGIKQVNGRRYSVGAVGIILYEASGSSESWAYSIGVPYAYTMELPDLHTFVVPADVIEPTANELLQGLSEYFKHIEHTDPDVYDNLVANVTLAKPKVDTTQSHQVVADVAMQLTCSYIYLAILIALVPIV